MLCREACWSINSIRALSLPVARPTTTAGWSDRQQLFPIGQVSAEENVHLPSDIEAVAVGGQVVHEGQAGRCRLIARTASAPLHVARETCGYWPIIPPHALMSFFGPSSLCSSSSQYSICHNLRDACIGMCKNRGGR
jgi:hypothetical protein